MLNRRAHHHAVEVWQGARRLYAVDPAPLREVAALPKREPDVFAVARTPAATLDCEVVQTRSGAQAMRDQAVDQHAAG